VIFFRCLLCYTANTALIISVVAICCRGSRIILVFSRLYTIRLVLRIIYERRACRSICRRRPAHFVVKLGQLIIIVVSSIRGSDYPSLSFTSVFILPLDDSLSHTYTHSLISSLSPRQPFSHCLYIAYIIYNAHFLLLCALLPHVCTTYSSRTHILYT